MPNKRSSNQGLILKKQDITLIKKSEEVKNVEVYGNLYECLKPYTVLSPKDLQNDIVFDDKARLTLMHNVKQMMGHVKKEWYAKTSFNTATVEVHCQLCGTKNTYVCYIANRKNGEELHVGRECVRKYQDINGANVILTQLSSKQRDIAKEARKNNFDVALGDDIDFTDKAKEEIETFPILLPYKLYTDIVDTVKTCNRIRTSYISVGGNLDECINKFMIKKSEYEKLYEDANKYFFQTKDNLLICTREIADWLKKYYPSVITDIQKSRGILNEETLQYVHEPNFISRNLSLFSSSIKDNDVTFLNVAGSVINFKIENDRYVKPIYFTMPVKSFMKNIGCHCLTEKGYRFGKNSLSPSIVQNSSNLNNVISYFLHILKNTEYSITVEEKTSQIYWIKNQKIISNKWSRHVGDKSAKPIFKTVKESKILDIMSQILLNDNKSENEIADIVIHKINMSGKWITKDEKDRNIKIASEAAGMQKQREFTPYV